MPNPLEFYFDFSSPYGYLTAQVIDDLAAEYDRSVDWKPHLIGVAFKNTGSQPLLHIPMKGDYARIDLPRWTRRMGVPFTLPDPFPFLSQQAARAFYWLNDDDPALAKTYAKAVYRAAFVEGRAINSPDTAADVAADVGIDRAAVVAAVSDPVMKDRLKAEVAAAIDRGIFGSPFIFVDGEPFWGHDRLDHIRDWLDTGGW